MPSPEPARSTPVYWRRTLRLSAVLLVIWLLTTLGVGLFGRWLTFDVLGWPFGFWLTAQGALIVFCVIVWVYALAMDRLELAERDDAGD